MLRKLILTTGKSNLTCLSSVMNLSSSSHKSTIDLNELSMFQKLSPDWWSETGIMKPLHSMNKLRVPFVRDGLINSGVVKSENIDTPKPLKDLKMLDVGCAGGILTEALSRIGGDITGIDISSELIDQAKHHAELDKSLSNLSYICSPIEEHSQNNLEKYDAVVTSEVIEHISEKDTFLKECVKCLKPGGSIFITTLNKSTLSWIAGIIIAENVLNIIPKGTHTWDKFIAPHQTQFILEENNCRTKAIHGMWYNFLTNKWSWSSNTSISYALHAVKH